MYKDLVNLFKAKI